MYFGEAGTEWVWAGNEYVWAGTECVGAGAIQTQEVLWELGKYSTMQPYLQPGKLPALNFSLSHTANHLTSIK